MGDAPDSPRSVEPAPDLIGVALGSLATGATAGAAAVAFALLAFRTHLGTLLPMLAFGGVVVSAATAWWLARPLASDAWRRGVTAALAVFLAQLLVFATAPADRLAGPAGLAVYAAALAGAAVLAARYTARRR